MKTALMLISLLLLSSNPLMASEGDHPTSKMLGHDIDLSTKGHTIAGRVGENIIFGDVSLNDGHKTSKLSVRTAHGLIETIFSKTDGVWGGILKNEKKVSNIKLVRLDTETATYTISVDDKEYNIRVEAEDFKNNHFIKPVYILEKDGVEIKAAMKEGQACYMYSLHLIFMIFGTYLF